MTKTTSAPRIAKMADPHPDDQRCAAIVAVHTAREFMSLVERSADGTARISSRELLTKTDHALHLAGSAVALCEEIDAVNTQKVISILSRCSSAIWATHAHCETKRDYDAIPEPSDWERRQATRFGGILRRSAQHAKQELHRALAELAELFPDAYDTEEPVA